MPERPRSESASKRLVGIDVLRAVSIVVVLGTHWGSAKLAEPMGVERWLNFVFAPGPYGVTLFFVISGFLICSTTMQRERNFFELSLRSFYVRRMARIQPLFWLSIVIGLVALTLGNPADEFFRF